MHSKLGLLWATALGIVASKFLKVVLYSSAIRLNTNGYRSMHLKTMLGRRYRKLPKNLQLSTELRNTDIGKFITL